MRKIQISDDALWNWEDKPWSIPKLDEFSLMQRTASASRADVRSTPSSDQEPSVATSDSEVWSAWLTDLHAVFRMILPELACREEITFTVSTWFLDHLSRHKCAMPKLLCLTDLPEDWYEELFFPWRFHMDRRLPVFISGVAPKQPVASFETHVADVILTQNPMDMHSVLFTAAIKDSLGPDLILPVAAVIQGDITKSVAIQQFACLSQVDVESIQVCCQNRALEAQACRPHDGMGVTIYATLPDANEEHEDDPQEVAQSSAPLAPAPKRNIEHEQVPASVVSSSERDDDHVSNVQLTAVTHPIWKNKDSPWNHENVFLQEAVHQNNIPDPGEVNDHVHISPDVEGEDDSDIADSPQEGSDTSSNSAYQNVWLFHLQEPVQLAVISWNRYDAMLRDVATVLRIPLDTLHSLYPLTCRPPNIPTEIEPLLVRFEDEMPDDGSQVLCLVDFEIHAQQGEINFATTPTLRRAAFPLSRVATRYQVLQDLAVDDYCSIENDRCLVFHQHQGWPLQSDESKILRNGDFLKIVIPPSTCRPGATTVLLDNHRRAAIALQRDFRVLEEMEQDMCDAELFNVLQVTVCKRASECAEQDSANAWEFPNDPDSPTVDAADTQAENEDAKQIHCSSTEAFLRAVQLYNQAEEDQLDFGPPPADLATQPAFVQALFPLWQEAARPGPGNIEMLARIETWFSDHINVQRSYHTRIAVLSPDYTTWESDLVRLWSDFRIQGADLQFAFVTPTPADIAANVLGQLILIQRADPRQASAIVTLSDSHVSHGQPGPCHDLENHACFCY
eukprot:s657_g10.t1